MASSKKAGGAKGSAASKKVMGAKKSTGARKPAATTKSAAAVKKAGAKKVGGASKTAGVRATAGKAAAAAPVSFAKQIVPLFRTMDVQCMRSRGVFLINYDYMKDPDNANMVLSMLQPDAEPRMPYGGPYWTDASIQLFQDWINGGLQP